MLATFSHETRGNADVLIICGEVDISNVSDFGRANDLATKDGAPNFVLDFTSVTYLDSTGLREVLRAQRFADANNLQMRAIAPAASIAHNILSHSGLVDPLAVAGSMTTSCRRTNLPETRHLLSLSTDKALFVSI